MSFIKNGFDFFTDVVFYNTVCNATSTHTNTKNISFMISVSKHYHGAVNILDGFFYGCSCCSRSSSV